MKELEIKTSGIGVLAYMIKVALVIISFFSSILAETVILYHLKEMYWYGDIMGFVGSSEINSLFQAFLIVWIIVNAIFAILLVFIYTPQCLWGWIFNLKRITKIDDNMITQIEYSYLYSKCDNTIMCHQITEIEVNQTIIDLMFNTGSIKIVGITKTNGESKKFEISIYQIDNPGEVKNKIIKLFPNYSPVEIKNITKE